MTTHTGGEMDPIHEKMMRMRADGWRFCHNKSARKHRRQGHRVRYFAHGMYAWIAPTKETES